MVEVPLRPALLRPDHSLPEDMQGIGEPGPFHWRLSVRAPLWRPPTDVYETQDAIVVRVEIAGMREDDFTIELDGRYLLIRGVRADVTERRSFYQMEIRYGEFSTEVELPAPVIAAEVQAEYNHGLLRVNLPIARAQKIPIE